MRFHLAAVSLVVLALTGGGAAAATVGTLTFDDNAWADGVVRTLGVGTGDPAFAGDGDIATAFDLRNDAAGDATIEILFTDNLLKNGPGADLVLFYGSNNNALSVTINGVTGSTNGNPFEFIANGGVGNNSGFDIVGALLDLGNFGVAADATLSGGIFLSRGGVFGTVYDAAALNSTDVSGTAVVPLPATLPLLAGGLAMVAAMRRRSA